MTIVWVISILFLAVFLMVSWRLLKRYGRERVSRRPDNLSGLPPEVRNSGSDRAA